jgi:restriction system protein
MSFWVVRAGRYGEQEDIVFSRNVVTIGWDEVPDLRSFASREAMRAALQQIYPNEKAQKLNVWTAQLWAFCNSIKENDLVALPLKRDGVVAFGRIAGGYRFAVDGGGHEIPVEWNDERIARHRIPQDIRYSLGSTLTVFQVRRNDAEARIRQLLTGTELV